MMLMSHVGDPDTWYNAKYTDTAKYGTRDEHYKIWESVLEEYRGHPWLGAHLGGNPENLPRLQSLLDRFPDLMLDCSATRWMAREVSAARRGPAPSSSKMSIELFLDPIRSAATIADSISWPADFGSTENYGKPITSAHPHLRSRSP